MTTFARRFAALVRRRATRRTFVVLLYAGVTTFAVAMTTLRASGAHPPAYVRVLLIACVAAMVAAPVGFYGLMFQLSLQRTLNGPDALVDERMMTRRHAALSIAFRIIAMLGVLEALVWSLRPFGILPKHADFATPFIFGNAIAALTLPLAVLAWTEPDPPDEPGVSAVTPLP